MPASITTMKQAKKMTLEMTPEKRARQKMVLKYLLWFLLFTALALLFYRCPFKMITGIDCPGCGLTRAFCCILLCDIPAAVQYHPLSPLIFAELFYLVYGQFVLGKKADRRFVAAGIFITALLMLAVWLCKIL